MSETIKCPTCGTELPPGALPGQCPRCLFGLGIEAAQEPQPRKGRHHFGGYELVAQLGCGGMGVVYEARQECLHRPVALKMILGAESCSPKTRRRFFIEAEAVARLDHPNIVQIYEVGEYEEQPFIAMKLVRGESLRGKMVRGEVGLTKHGAGLTSSVSAERQKALARLVATLARAVHHAHQHNVVHRDLKPENVLIEADGTPYLTDFGVAKLLDLDGSTAKTESIGTLAYMSPEQFNSDRITPATDIYSLGVNLFELLAGRVPFHEASRDETSRAIETQPPTRLRKLNHSINKDLETICLKCLEKSPGSRYGTALELAEDLENWLQGRPIKARPAGPFLRLGRWTKRNPMAAALILSLILALAAGIGLLVQIDKVGKERMRMMSRELSKQTIKLWKDPLVTSLVMSAEDLALLRGRVLNTNGMTLLTLALNIQADPIVQVWAYTPMLDFLASLMSKAMGRPIAFNLKLCKTSEQSPHEMAGGQVDFQRLGAVAYLQAKELSPGVQAVVQEIVGKDAVIVVTNGSPITGLSGFAGKRFGVSDTNSTLGVWAKVYLMKHGVSRTNLSLYKVFGETNLLGMPGVPPANSAAGQSGVSSTASGPAMAMKVLDGALDGTVLQRSYFEKLQGRPPGLREVYSFASTPNVYVGRAGLDPLVVAAFRAAMLSIKSNILSRLPNAQGFQPLSLTEMGKLRSAMTNEAAQFDGVAPPPHPTQSVK